MDAAESAAAANTPRTTAKGLLIPLLLTLLVVHLLRNKFKPGLAKIPGPPLAAFTKLWRLHDVWKGQAHLTAIALHRRYGSLVRIGPNHVSVSDPREIVNIYGLNKGYTKTAFYPIQCISWQKKPQMNLFSTRDEQYHRDQKRPVAGAYSMTSILTKEAAVDSCTTLFMRQLATFAESKAPVNLGEWLQFYAFDVVGELSFALKLGFLQQGKDVDGMIEAIKGMLVYASHCGQVPEAHPFLLGNPLFPIFIPSMETWNQVLNFTLKAVNAALGDQQAQLKRDGELDAAALDAKGDMLSRWSAVKMTDPARLSTRDIIVHLSTNVFAGSDTTAIALRAILYLLLRNPDKLRKLVADIDAADAAGSLSDPVQYREAVACLPYLDAVIKEAMRVHPSVGLLLERHVPPGGATICGRYMPAGTIVGVNAWVTQHDAAVFPEPEKFVPERWLESSAEQLKLMEQSYFAWGAGSRTCVGKHMAVMEMTKVVPQLLREFDVALTYPEKEWRTRNIWFVQQEGLICNLTKRR